MKTTIQIAALSCAAVFLPTLQANDIALFRTTFNTDLAAAGVGGLRNQTSGVLTLAGVSGPVTKAYLYWHGPTNSSSPTANASVLLNGNPVAGTNIGLSSDNCWGFANSQAYRAEVTALVSGNGAYTLSGFLANSSVNINGASLIVFYDDGNAANNRDVVLFDGNDSNINNSFDSPGWNVTLSGINYTAGTAFKRLHVSDGQTFLDDAIRVNAVVLAPAGLVFSGNTVPSANNGPANNGSLWDIRSFDVTALLSPGPNTLSLTTGVNGDCLSLVVAIVDLPAGAAPGQRITLAPATATNCTGTSHTITATIKNDSNAPVPGKTVNFKVISGPNVGLTGSGTTGATGVTNFSYVGNTAGTDVIEACFADANAQTQCARSTKAWTVCNLPPVVSSARPSVSCLWPPNHKFVPIQILGVTDPDGDPVSIVITGVTSDEPTATIVGAGGTKKAPDAQGVGTDAALVRSERSGTGDGRVYVISFVAKDGRGGETPGVVRVNVAHSGAGACTAVDSGQNYDATQ